jgi:hypothetical protein
MRSYLQQSIGLDALFKSRRQHIKNPAKDFCWWDLDGVVVVVVVCAVVDGSLDLSARATSSTSFFI